MKHFSRRYFVMPVLFYSAFIIYATTVPFEFKAVGWEALWSRALGLWQDTQFGISIGDVVSNFFLFFVLGVLLKCTFLPHARFHGFKLCASIFYGFALSYLVEVVQIQFPGRVSSLFDVWIDGLSASFGILLLWNFQNSKITRQISYTFVRLLRDNPYALGSLFTALIILLGALFPFNLIPGIEHFSNRFHAENVLKEFWAIDWTDTQIWIKSLFTLLLYFLFSYLTFLTFIYRKSKEAYWVLPLTLSVTFFLAGTCEFLQVLFPPAFFEISQIVMGALGGVLGIIVGKLMKSFMMARTKFNIKSGRRLVDCPLLFALIIVSLLMLIDWLRPFHLPRDYQGLLEEFRSHMEVLPFQNYSKAFFWTFEGFFRKFFLLLSWSIFFSLWIVERSSKIKINPLLVGLSTGLSALFLELLQIPIEGRVFALNDVFWGCIAGLLGGSLARIVARAHRAIHEQEIELPLRQPQV